MSWRSKSWRPTIWARSPLRSTRTRSETWARKSKNSVSRSLSLRISRKMTSKSMHCQCKSGQPRSKSLSKSWACSKSSKRISRASIAVSVANMMWRCKRITREKKRSSLRISRELRSWRILWESSKRDVSRSRVNLSRTRLLPSRNWSLHSSS